MCLALITLSSFGVCEARVVTVHVPKTYSEIFTANGMLIWVDYLFYEFFGMTLRSPAIEYKGKHEDETKMTTMKKNPFVQAYKVGGHGLPRVTSLETTIKNNLILWTSIGAVWGCWISGWGTLFWDNDAGAFFVDCLTMWTQFVYFYKDEKNIQYSYV